MGGLVAAMWYMVLLAAARVLQSLGTTCFSPSASCTGRVKVQLQLLVACVPDCCAVLCCRTPTLRTP
jgi:hypothetical protein